MVSRPSATSADGDLITCELLAWAMKDYSEYKDYGEYLEEAYEEWADKIEKENGKQGQM